MILSPPAIVFHFSPVVHNDYAGKDDDGDDEIITFYVEGKVRLVPKHQAPRPLVQGAHQNKVNTGATLP